MNTLELMEFWGKKDEMEQLIKKIKYSVRERVGKTINSKNAYCCSCSPRRHDIVDHTISRRYKSIHITVPTSIDCTGTLESIKHGISFWSNNFPPK